MLLIGEHEGGRRGEAPRARHNGVHVYGMDCKPRTWSASAITVIGESPPVPSVVSYSSFSRDGPNTSMTSTARGSETDEYDPEVVGGG